MSLTNRREMTEESLAAPQANGPESQGPITPEDRSKAALANMREGFYDRPRAEVLAALGEEPEEYLCLMESLQEDLQPRPGLENMLVTQIGETLWGMQRAQRMREGLALRRIQSKVLGEEMSATTVAAKAVENLEPFELLQAALTRRDNGPTAEEIDAFVKYRKGDTSAETQEFLHLLRSLKEPMEEPERKAARRQARKQLGRLMESYQSVAWRMARQLHRVQSPENLAALAAPGDHNATYVQSLEDSCLRRLWRLTNMLAKVKDGAFHSKNKKNNERSWNVYENKQNSDNMPDEKPDISAESTEFLQKKAAL